MTKENELLIELIKKQLEIMTELLNMQIKDLQETDDATTFFGNKDAENLNKKLEQIAKQKDKIIKEAFVKEALTNLFENINEAFNKIRDNEDDCEEVQ